VVNIEQDITY